VSPEHPKGDNHTPGGSVVLMVGPGDRFLSGVSYITATYRRCSAFGPLLAAMAWRLAVVTA
jgi:hypothetical protein